MKRGFFALAAVAFSTSLACADVSFRTVLAGSQEMEYTLPSGETKTMKFQGASSSLGGNSLTIPDSMKSLKVTFKDDMGSLLWSGSLRNHVWSVLHMGADGKPAVGQCGWFVDTGQTQPSAIILVNFTGQPLVVDCFGTRGTAGVKDTKLSAAADFQTPLRLPQEESAYNIVVKDASGQELNRAYNFLSKGRVCALYKTPEGKFEVQELGWIRSPGKKYE